MRCGHESRLCDQSRLFQVTIGNSSGRIVCRDYGTLYIIGKGISPQVALTGVIKVDSTHAGFGRVGSADESGLLRYDLSEVRRSVTQAGC